MKDVEALHGIDIYLIDQLLKGRINSNSRILDAGCGSGRNLHYLIEQGCNVTGFDTDQLVIQTLSNQHSERASFLVNAIEEFEDERGFDFIICNAVLHFAQSHTHFNEMFQRLAEVLVSGGILFIRMTSNIGMSSNPEEIGGGVYKLPDLTTRYLITRSKIESLCAQYDLSLIEPVKTVLVDDLRAMTTLVFQK